jgi:chromosome segregation ATPase
MALFWSACHSSRPDIARALLGSLHVPAAVLPHKRLTKPAPAALHRREEAEAAVAKLSAAQKELEAAQTDSKKAADELAAAKSDLAAARKAADKAADQLAGAKGDITTMKGELVAARTELANLQKQLSSKGDELKDVKAQLAKALEAQVGGWWG